ncbi:hypothetical protein GmHk_02G003533 [Glycine max]|nr:hypothetical protein GmHk_02G003533 [Glycine max]
MPLNYLIMSELTIEEHGEWREMANMMQNVVAPPEAFFQTVLAKDQIFGEISKVYAVKWEDVLDDGNYHNVVYNKDLDQPVIVAGWTTLRDFYQLTGDHLVSLTHYGCSKQHTHLHLENVAECRLMFNHWRKTLRIGAGWKHLCETLSLKVDMEIVFEFIDPTINRVLYWPCL